VKRVRRVDPSVEEKKSTARALLEERRQYLSGEPSKRGRREKGIGGNADTEAEATHGETPFGAVRGDVRAASDAPQEGTDGREKKKVLGIMLPKIDLR